MKENTTQNPNYSFSGHETFACRSFWLKKGYNYFKSNKKFSSSESVIELGVGKNMVNAIFFLAKSNFDRIRRIEND